jgi:hypothetical protein
MFRANTKDRACAHVLQRCHTTLSTGPRLSVQERFGVVTRPSASDSTFPSRRALALPCVRQHRTPPLRQGRLRRSHVSLGSRPQPASAVGFDADTCHMTLREPWAVEIKKGMAATACSKPRVFSRHARELSRCLQDV